MKETYKKEFNVGIIQPVINPDLFWNEDYAFVQAEKKRKKATPYRLNIEPLFAERVWHEILEGISSLIRVDEKPDVILIPELHLPVARVADLKRISKRHGVMIIAGLDFERNPLDRNKIRNRGALIIPGAFGNDFTNRQTTLYFGKTYFTYMEREMFKNIEGEPCDEDQEQNMYIFKSDVFGNFGIMICSDIFDIERMILYQGRIHHLFIISLNKDLNTYFAMAESLTRLLYCNVVICNTGFYGGSLAFSPYREANQRTIYKYHGQKTCTTHQVCLPLVALAKAQEFNFSKDAKQSNELEFKASPPGYRHYPE